MNVLALDISAASCGLAVGSADGAPRTSLRKTAGDTTGAKGAAFTAFVNDILTVEQPDLVMIEAPLMATSVPRSAATAWLLIGLAHNAETVCAERGVQCERVAVQTWRARVLGRGNIRRDEAKERALRLCAAAGWDTGGSHDRAEAACIWAYAHLQFGQRRAIRATLDRQGAVVFAGGAPA